MPTLLPIIFCDLTRHAACHSCVYTFLLKASICKSASFTFKLGIITDDCFNVSTCDYGKKLCR